jgi:hypothetical protein
VSRLVAELQALIDADLTHPAIAAPLAAGITGGSAYLAQDFVVAESLDALVGSHGPVGAAEAARVAAQVAGALDFAAAGNIAHGALHPHDVLVSSDETRLTGLGLARALETVGAAAAVRWPYAAPERAAGAAWDRRADVFSLAAIVYELLWSRRVTALGQQAAATLTEVAGGDLDALRSVFASALAENPAERFETALEFAAAFGDAISAASRQVSGQESTASSRRRTRPRSDDRPPVSDEPRLPLGGPAPVDVGWDASDEEGDFDVAKVVAELSLSLGGQPQVERPAPRAAAIAADPGPAPSEPPASPVAYPSVIPVPASLDVAETSRERSRSSVWPLTLALVLGVAVGFALGYGVASRARQGPSPQAEAPGSPPPSARGTAQSGVAETEVRLVPAPASAAILPSPPPASAGGRLLIRSTPAGAGAFLDGLDIGRTPVTMREVERGTHTVRVVRDGYVAEERHVTITAGRLSQSLTFELTRARPAPPSAPSAIEHERVPLTVESRPPGASVFVDGTLIGKTPLTLGEVAAGDHAVSLNLDGYRRWSSSVRIVAGERNRVTASLERP